MSKSVSTGTAIALQLAGLVERIDELAKRGVSHLIGVYQTKTKLARKVYARSIKSTMTSIAK